MKKLIALTLALIMAFTLAACGNGGRTNPPQGNTTPQGGNTPGDTSAPSAPGSQTPSKQTFNFDPEPADQFVYEYGRVSGGARLVENNGYLQPEGYGYETRFLFDGQPITDYTEGLILTKYLGDKTQLRVPDEIDGFPVIGIAETCFKVSVVTDVLFPDTLQYFAFGGMALESGAPDFGHQKLPKEFVIPYGVTYIVGPKTFHPSSIVGDVTTVVIPDTVTRIGSQAFEDFKSLMHVVIPSSVKQIGHRAFFHCNSFLKIDVPDSVISVGAEAFDDTSWWDMQPSGLVYAGKVAYAWKGDIPPNTHIPIEEGIRAIAMGAFSNDSTNYSAENLIGITIPDSVTYIGDFAFRGCTSLDDATRARILSINPDAEFNTQSHKGGPPS